MDSTASLRGASDEVDRNDSDPDPIHTHKKQLSQELPDDLPKSLDDRRSVPMIQPETEMYDGWQGAQLLPRCTVAQAAGTKDSFRGHGDFPQLYIQTRPCYAQPTKS